MNRPRTLRWFLVAFGSVTLLNLGCVHTIHVAPAPPGVAQTPIPRSLHVLVPFVALEGADHMPGIGSFDWPSKDLRAAAIGYLQQRQTFDSVGDPPRDVTLTMKAWLTMRSRGKYYYTLRLETDIGPAGTPSIKSYIVEKEAEGSTVRWVTASDEQPIAQVVQAAFDELCTRIEADHALYRTSRSPAGKN